VDTQDKPIDYRGIASKDPSSLLGKIYAQLEEAFGILQSKGLAPHEGEVVYTANGQDRGAVAMLEFLQNKQVRLKAYIESPLWYMPIIFSDAIDVNHDGNKDIVLITYSGNYLNIESPWILLYDHGSYRLVVPLTPTTADRDKALKGEVQASNAMELRASAGSSAVWLRDLDNDGTLEVVTLDQGSFTEPSESNQQNVFQKRIYALKNDTYVLESTTEISAGSDEFKAMMNWPTTPNLSQ
jgi:hypothetical protein